MHLVLGGDLDQLHLALAPVADWLDPQARATFVMGLEVLEVVELTVALDEAEAARAGVAERADLQFLRVGERPP